MSEKKEQSQAVGYADPFLITTVDRLSFILMEREGLFSHPSYTPEEIKGLTKQLRRESTEWDPERNMLPGQSRTDMRKRNEVRLFFERFTLGVFGGVAIIAPMLIMALSNSLLVSLVVTSVTTILFAVLLALPMIGGALDGKTVLAAVAAYAAILVVFVGTSLSVM